MTELHILAQYENQLPDTSEVLVNDISQMIEEARNHVAREYNSTQVLLC